MRQCVPCDEVVSHPGLAQLQAVSGEDRPACPVVIPIVLRSASDDVLKPAVSPGRNIIIRGDG
jgi:hypothetical protein